MILKLIPKQMGDDKSGSCSYKQLPVYIKCHGVRMISISISISWTKKFEYLYTKTIDIKFHKVPRREYDY